MGRGVKCTDEKIISVFRCCDNKIDNKMVDNKMVDNKNGGQSVISNKMELHVNGYISVSILGVSIEIFSYLVSICSCWHKTFV